MTIFRLRFDDGKNREDFHFILPNIKTRHNAGSKIFEIVS
jgi:hypothetical protein